MGKLLVKDKDIVIPGQALAEGMDYLPARGTYREKNEIRSLQIGMVSISGRLIKLIPLSGIYIPKANDNVIGKVAHVGISSWFVDIGFYNQANLSLKEASTDYIARGADLTRYYNFGDYIVTKITKVTKTKLIDITMKARGLRKLDKGRLIKVNPVKVPRIIGKAGSMISMIKEQTNCKIIVGQNGLIWLSGLDSDKERLAIKAIKLIEKEAHKEGLTDKIKKMLEKKESKK